MAAGTRDSSMLRELFGAAGNDPLIVAETLARQTLVDRLIREAYANDDRFHGPVRKRAEAGLATCSHASCMKSIGDDYSETVWTLSPTESPATAQEKGNAEVGLGAEEWARLRERLSSTIGGSYDHIVQGQPGLLEETSDAFVVRR